MTRWEKGLWRTLPRSERRPLLAVYRSLEARYGPFDRLTREYARLTAEAWWTAVQASEAALQEGAKRRHGRGRRPSLSMLDRRMKRQGLGTASLDQLVRRLEELATKRNGHRSPPSPSSAAEAARAALALSGARGEA